MELAIDSVIMNSNHGGKTLVPINNLVQLMVESRKTIIKINCKPSRSKLMITAKESGHGGYGR